MNQFRQLHFMLPRWRAEMERELPEVISGLEDLGGVRTSMLGALPDEMTGGKRDGDERFETVTGRAPRYSVPGPARAELLAALVP